MDTYTITFSDGTSQDFTVTNALSITGISKTGTAGLVDTYTISLSDGTSETFTVTNALSISSITQTGTDGLVDTYKITFSDGTSQDFTVTNGRSITDIEKIDTNGLVDTYKISFSDNTSFNLSITNGSSIKNIAKTGTSGLEDTYTVTLTDDTTSNFTVKNGNGIASIALQSGTHSPGTTDTYKITFTNGEYTTFSVYNGLNGTGSVSSVNGSDPDGSGDVTVTGADIPVSAEDETTLTAAIAARLSAAAGAVGTDNLGAGVVTRAKMAADAFAIADNAGAHNAIYRGKYLGTSVTAAQWAAIANGTFADLYIGDYWKINEVNWRIAAFDYYYKTGDTDCTTHHAVIVPDVRLYSARMNETDDTTGGYVGSEMYTANLEQAKTAINAAFGADHILSHRQSLINAVTNGVPSGVSWYDSTVELMTERNVYGNEVMGWSSNGSAPFVYTVDKTQYPLFAHDPSMIVRRIWFWLRDTASAATFCAAGYAGQANRTEASTSGGVRPAFCIKA